MKKSNIYFLLFVFALLLNACTYDFIVKEELPPVDPTVDVLFSTQIVPIFAASCVSCHKPGGTAPDLTAPNAYNSIKTMNLANTAAPESSLVYTYPSPTTTLHTWKKYSAAEAQLVLTWIQQGAKNN
jgi:mono/diheme cytochrome c family protein